MVSLNVNDINEDPNVVQPAHAEEDSFGEQYFPREMSWYAAEGPQGLIEAGARKVRENPWAAVGIALAAGFTLAMVGGPLIRAAMAGCELAASKLRDETTPESGIDPEPPVDDCPCD
jgi:hypothetical protein